MKDRCVVFFFHVGYVRHLIGIVIFSTEIVVSGFRGSPRLLKTRTLCPGFPSSLIIGGKRNNSLATCVPSHASLNAADHVEKDNFNICIFIVH